ncbi:hypothetical protein PM082_015001 [Marasmius tenuissimus]|nr:hypothetical protein PM082_015001 [Marasmius tenuissimus]
MAEQLRHNPSNEICLDYMHNHYQASSLTLTSNDDLPDVTNNEWAVDHLKELWRSENEEHRTVWQQQVEANQILEGQRHQQEEAAEALVAEEVKKVQEEKKEKEKKREILHKFQLGTPMS